METIELKVSEGTGKKKFQCTYKYYDMGDPIGYSNSVDGAIAAFLESFRLKFDFTPKYKWS